MYDHKLCCVLLCYSIIIHCLQHWGPKSPVMQSYGIQKSIYGRFLFHFVIWEIFKRRTTVGFRSPAALKNMSLRARENFDRLWWSSRPLTCPQLIYHHFSVVSFVSPKNSVPNLSLKFNQTPPWRASRPHPQGPEPGPLRVSGRSWHA